MRLLSVDSGGATIIHLIYSQIIQEKSPSPGERLEGRGDILAVTLSPPGRKSSLPFILWITQVNR
jgi:hypothetical protein